jgi:hypothetical protein
MSAGHTPGPWAFRPISGDDGLGYIEADGHDIIHAGVSDLPAEENVANARLIAAAPDHALIGWAMCVGAGRWESFSSGIGGEFCMNGLRHATALDEFGCPVLTDALRSAITRAQRGS